MNVRNIEKTITFGNAVFGITTLSAEISRFLVNSDPNLNIDILTQVHALKMESGRVKFYSQSESEGEDEPKKAALSLRWDYLWKIITSKFIFYTV